MLCKRIIFLIVLIFFGFLVNLNAQNRKYLYIGVDADLFLEPAPISLIINDFNSFHDNSDQSTNSQLIVPEYFPGAMIGTKIHSRFSEFGGNVHYSQYRTNATGIDLNGDNYSESFTISHNGITVHYQLNIVNTNYFRMGPRFGIKLDQYKVRLSTDSESNYNAVVPTNRAVVAGRFSYTISIGGPKFNLDLSAFYCLPFHFIDLNHLNETLNYGYHTNYTNGELNFNPLAYGVSVCIAFGSKQNYDF
jgi:hypothetical protein